MVLAVCVAAVAADFVGLNPEQLARVGRQQEEAQAAEAVCEQDRKEVQPTRAKREDRTEYAEGAKADRGGGPPDPSRKINPSGQGKKHFFVSFLTKATRYYF